MGAGNKVRIHSARDFIKLIDRLVQKAKEHSLEGEVSCRSRLRRSRQWMRDIFNSNFMQVTVAILIVMNFAANAYEAQKNGHLMYPDGSPTPDAQILEHLDIAFTVVFTGCTFLALTPTLERTATAIAHIFFPKEQQCKRIELAHSFRLLFFSKSMCQTALDPSAAGTPFFTKGKEG